MDIEGSHSPHQDSPVSIKGVLWETFRKTERGPSGIRKIFLTPFVTLLGSGDVSGSYNFTNFNIK